MFDTVTSYDVDSVPLRMEEPINVSIVYNINDCVHTLDRIDRYASWN